jgi:membrane protein YqaA with SNARE-associated domain
MSAPAGAAEDAQRAAPAWAARLLGREGIALAGLWGFAEGTLFFVVPDVLLSLAALSGGRRALPHVAAAVGGALLAGAVMVSWSAADYRAASGAVRNVPFVREAMFARVDEGLEQDGAAALFRGSVTGIPYKIFAVEAPGRISAPHFLAWTVPARAARFLLVWALFALLGAWLRSRYPNNWRLLAAVHAALWIPFYLYYWSVV